MNVKHFTVPPDAYPRYRHVREHIPPLLERFQEVTGKCAVKDPFPVPKFGDVNIYIFSENEVDFVSQEELTKRKYENIRYEMLRCETPGDFMAMTKGQVFVSVARYSEVMSKDHMWPFLTPAVFLLGTESEISISDIKTPDDDKIVSIRTKDNFSSELDLVLERIVFRHLFLRVRVLRAFLRTEPAVLIFAAFNTSVQNELTGKLKKKTMRGSSSLQEYDEFYMYREWHDARLAVIKSLVTKVYGKDCREIKDQILRTPGRQDTGIEVRPLTVAEHILPFVSIEIQPVQKPIPDVLVSKMACMKVAHEKQMEADFVAAQFKENLDGITDNRSEIEQLYEECIAMYRRSKVPDFERPLQQMYTNSLDKQMAEAILEVNGVTGCGYRFSTLDVYFTESLKEPERKQSEARVQKIIDGKVERFAFLTERKLMKLGDPSVGTKLLGKLGNSASLGGFAERGDQKQLCLLVARHFAENCDDIFVETTSGKHCIAKVLHPIRREDEDTMDISAADVLCEVTKRCVKQFKNSYGEHIESQLQRFDHRDIEIMKGLPVHIWGATSSPGLGIIVIPDYYVQGMQRLVKIEDRHPTSRSAEPFAKEGDSGSVVCADDTAGERVNVISMLMGLSDVVDFKGIKKQQYLTFRMPDGLTQLERLTGDHFNIC